LCIDFFRYFSYRHFMTQTPSNATPPASFREVIGRWPATRHFARDAGCSALLVRQWRHRNFIPPQYWPGIVAGAQRRKIAAVDADLLARLAALLRGGGRSGICSDGAIQATAQQIGAAHIRQGGPA
jgi:hypothetical protein